MSGEVSLVSTGKASRAAANAMAVMSAQIRDEALEAIAKGLDANFERILQANKEDCAEAEGNIPAPLYARLKLGENKLRGAVLGVRSVAKLPDPVGDLQMHTLLDEGLTLKRVSCPVGVLGIIFEARPDALIQITSLAIKSGNAVLLKPGRESLRTCREITRIIHEALAGSAVPVESVVLLTSREEIRALLTLDKYVDLVIPRGSNAFVRYVQDNTRIPVLGHAEGLCHVYVHDASDVETWSRIVVDSKTQYPSACNTLETLLVREECAAAFLPQAAKSLSEAGVELRVDAACRAVLEGEGLALVDATEEDWAAEYSDLVLSVKMVKGMKEAMEHISEYGSKHTECILTQDEQAATRFAGGVDAAGVFHNCSTRFADGFRYGFGAEVGISTQKMPPRGPVGLEGLVTYKYIAVGKGHIVADYSGDNPKPYLHKNLMA